MSVSVASGSTEVGEVWSLSSRSDRGTSVWSVSNLTSAEWPSTASCSAAFLSAADAVWFGQQLPAQASFAAGPGGPVCSFPLQHSPPSCNPVVLKDRGHWTSSMGRTWEPVKNVNSWASPQTYCLWQCGPGILALTRLPGDSDAHYNLGICATSRQPTVSPLRLKLTEAESVVCNLTLTESQSLLSCYL